MDKSKESIFKLVLIYKQDDMVLDYIHDVLNEMGKYVDIINKQENYINVYKNSVSPEELRSAIITMDKQRRIIHNCVISGVTKINSLCKENKIPLFYNGDEDRTAIGDFAMSIVKNNFDNRRK